MGRLVFLEQLPRLLEEQLGGVVDEGLVLHERRHGKGRVHGTAELLVEVIVGRAEQTLQRMSLDDGLLDNVEVGLDCTSTSSSL